MTFLIVPGKTFLIGLLIQRVPPVKNVLHQIHFIFDKIIQGNNFPLLKRALCGVCFDKVQM